MFGNVVLAHKRVARHALVVTNQPLNIQSSPERPPLGVRGQVDVERSRSRRRRGRRGHG